MSWEPDQGVHKQAQWGLLIPTRLIAVCRASYTTSPNKNFAKNHSRKRKVSKGANFSKGVHIRESESFTLGFLQVSDNQYDLVHRNTNLRRALLPNPPGTHQSWAQTCPEISAPTPQSIASSAPTAHTTRVSKACQSPNQCIISKTSKKKKWCNYPKVAILYPKTTFCGIFLVDERPRTDRIIHA